MDLSRSGHAWESPQHLVSHRECIDLWLEDHLSGTESAVGAGWSGEVASGPSQDAHCIWSLTLWRGSVRLTAFHPSVKSFQLGWFYTGHRKATDTSVTCTMNGSPEHHEQNVSIEPSSTSSGKGQGFDCSLALHTFTCRCWLYICVLFVVLYFSDSKMFSEKFWWWEPYNSYLKSLLLRVIMKFYFSVEMIIQLHSRYLMVEYNMILNTIQKEEIKTLFRLDTHKDIHTLPLWASYGVSFGEKDLWRNDTARYRECTVYRLLAFCCDVSDCVQSTGYSLTSRTWTMDSYRAQAVHRRQFKLTFICTQNWPIWRFASNRHLASNTHIFMI